MGKRQLKNCMKWVERGTTSVPFSKKDLDFLKNFPGLTGLEMEELQEAAKGVYCTIEDEAAKNLVSK